jgi:two-component sensor histidine kinase
MLTATGHLNSVVVQWSQSNADSHQAISQYIKSGNIEVLENYEEAIKIRNYAGNIIDELLHDSPNTEFIFNRFNSEKNHPNEISGLIRIFSLFGDHYEIEQVKKTWSSLRQQTIDKNKLIKSLVLSKDSGGIVHEDVFRSIEHLDHQIHSDVLHMVTATANISLLLKKYSLWFTVLLGILIVLIGIVYTVRGVKTIQGVQQLLSERDYLAKFPELNQFPVLNLDVNGRVAFLNAAAKDLFPDLEEKGLQHPFLSVLNSNFHEVTKSTDNTLLYEVGLNDRYFQQDIHYLSKEEGIHIHSIDITALKKKQLELSYTLKEKETLLAEVHHRVNNNMAVITSLLELQEVMGQDPEAALIESKSRIQSMAIVHELLYQNDSFSLIDTDQFLRKIGEHLRATLSNIQSISVLDSIENKTLNINQAVPLGLFLNEITFYVNHQAIAKKHQLNLKLQIEGNGQKTCLRLSSPQPGIENPLQSGNDSSLRVSLIEILLAQINGVLIMPESETLLIEMHFLLQSKKGSSSNLV